MNTTNTQDPIKLALVKLNAALMCHPNAVETLIEEAIELLQPAAAQPQGDAREAFEAWAQGEKMSMRRSQYHDGYDNPETDAAWAAWQASTQPRVWTPEEIEAANKRAAEYTDWYLSGGKIASTQASEPSAAPARAVEPLTDELIGLLEEVSRCFTRNDDLPDELLPRIDAAIERAHGIGIPATTPTKTQGGAA